jgi:hypothetical protein
MAALRCCARTDMTWICDCSAPATRNGNVQVLRYHIPGRLVAAAFSGDLIYSTIIESVYTFSDGPNVDGICRKDLRIWPIVHTMDDGSLAQNSATDS